MAGEIRLSVHGRRSGAAARAPPERRGRSRLRDRFPHPPARDRRDDAEDAILYLEGDTTAPPRGVPARARGDSTRGSSSPTRTGTSSRSTCRSPTATSASSAPWPRTTPRRGRVPPHVYVAATRSCWAHDAGDGSLLLAPLAAGHDGRPTCDSARRLAQAAPPHGFLAAIPLSRQSSCQRSIVASGAPRQAASCSRRSAAAATCCSGRRWIVERCRLRSCSAACRRVTKPSCSNVRAARRRSRQRSARSQASRPREALEIDRGRSGRYGRRWWPVKCSGANVQMKTPTLGREHAARLAQRELSALTERVGRRGAS